MLKISVVTPSYNQGEFLEETLLSVQHQRYPNVEHIVIDGGSSDESVEIIKKHSEHLAYWVSEKDGGQANAINKGLARCTGDLVAILNSDDVYLPGALDFVAEQFELRPEMVWMTAPSLFWGPDKATMRAEVMQVLVPKKPADWFVHQSIPHPSTFIRKSVLDKYGLLNEEFKFTVDLEYWFRIFFAGERPVVFDRPLSGYRLHGLSKTISQQDVARNDSDRLYAMYLPRLSPSEQKRARRDDARMKSRFELWRCLDPLNAGNATQGRVRWKQVVSEHSLAWTTKAFYTTFVRLFILKR